MVCSGLIERLTKLLVGCPFREDCEYYNAGMEFECDDNNHTRCGHFKTLKLGPPKYLVKITIPRKQEKKKLG